LKTVDSGRYFKIDLSGIRAGLFFRSLGSVHRDNYMPLLMATSLAEKFNLI
jgi:hypothetical protein